MSELEIKYEQKPLPKESDPSRDYLNELKKNIESDTSVNLEQKESRDTSVNSNDLKSLVSLQINSIDSDNSFTKVIKSSEDPLSVSREMSPPIIKSQQTTSKY